MSRREGLHPPPPAPSSRHSRARGGGRSGAPRPREHVNHTPNAQGWPARCCRPSQSEPTGWGRPRYSNQPHRKVASRIVTGRRGTRRDSPARGPIGERRRAAAGPWRGSPPISPSGGRGQPRYTKGGGGLDKNRNDAESPAKRGGARWRVFLQCRAARPALSSPFPSPPAARQPAASRGSFLRPLHPGIPGLPGGLPDKHLGERQGSLPTAPEATCTGGAGQLARRGRPGPPRPAPRLSPVPAARNKALPSPLPERTPASE